MAAIIKLGGGVGCGNWCIRGVHGNIRCRPWYLLLFDTFLVNKVNFMADIRSKYVCRSAVALVETHSFGVPFFPFPFSGGIGKLISAGYDRKVLEYTEFLLTIQPRE